MASEPEPVAQDSGEEMVRRRLERAKAGLQQQQAPAPAPAASNELSGEAKAMVDRRLSRAKEADEPAAPEAAGVDLLGVAREGAAKSGPLPPQTNLEQLSSAVTEIGRMAVEGIGFLPEGKLNAIGRVSPPRHFGYPNLVEWGKLAYGSEPPSMASLNALADRDMGVKLMMDALLEIKQNNAALPKRDRAAEKADIENNIYDAEMWRKTSPGGTGLLDRVKSRTESAFAASQAENPFLETDDDVRRVAWDMIQWRSAGKAIEDHPWWVRYGIGGLSSGVGTGLIAKGAVKALGLVGKAAGAAAGSSNAAVRAVAAPVASAVGSNFTRGAIAGGITSAAVQGVQMKSGARDKFSPGEAVIEMGTMGAGTAAGVAVGRLVKASGVSRQTANALAERVSGIGGDALEVMFDRQAMQASGQEPPPLYQQFFQAAMQGIGSTAAGGGHAANLDVADAAKTAKPSPTQADVDLKKATKQTADSIGQWVRGLLRSSDDPVRIAGFEQAVTDEVLPKEVEVSKVHKQASDFFKKAVGDDPATRRQLGEALVARVEGSPDAANMPIPEGVTPEQLAQGEALMRKYGEAGLGIGEVWKNHNIIPEARYRPVGAPDDGSQDINVMKRDFDKGFIQNADGSKIPVARDGNLGQLVGGYNFHAQRGFFLPQVEHLDFALADVFKGTPPPAAYGKGSKNSPFNTFSANARRQRRQHSTADALLMRELDFDPNTLKRTFDEQADAARKKTLLDIARESGDVRTEEELPNADERERLKEEAKGLNEGVEQIVSRIKDTESPLTRDERGEARAELLAMKTRLRDIKKILSDTFYKKALTDDWGEYKGMYIHPAVYKHVTRGSGPRSGLGHAISAIVNMAKKNLVASNLKQGVGDLLGWVEIARQNHLDISEAIADAQAAEMGWREPTDIDYEFESLARGAALGGPADISTKDSSHLRDIKRAIGEAEGTGRGTAALKLAAAVEGRGQLLEVAKNKARSYGKVPGALVGAATAPLRLAEKIGDARLKLIDRSAARAIYTALRGEGLSPAKAFAEVQEMMDYGKLPGVAQRAGDVFSFSRFYSKIVHAHKQIMQVEPRAFGKKIPTPFDKMILDDPGSPKARIALVARGLTNLAVNATKVIAPIAGAAKVMRDDLGISEEEMDKFIEDSQGQQPPYVRWLMKQMFIPTSRSPGGRIDGIDTSAWFPQVMAMKFFWLAASNKYEGKGTNTLRNLAGKHVLAGPIANAMSKTDYKGKPLEEGAGPTESGWGVIKTGIPAIIANPITAYFNQENVPMNERQAMMMWLREATGFPLTSLRRDNPFDKKIKEFRDEGLLGVERRDDGSWNYYVKNPKHPKAPFVQDWINRAREFGALNPLKAQMKHERNMTLIKEGLEK